MIQPSPCPAPPPNRHPLQPPLHRSSGERPGYLSLFLPGIRALLPDPPGRELCAAFCARRMGSFSASGHLRQTTLSGCHPLGLKTTTPLFQSPTVKCAVLPWGRCKGSERADLYFPVCYSIRGIVAPTVQQVMMSMIQEIIRALRTCQVLS